MRKKILGLIIIIVLINISYVYGASFDLDKVFQGAHGFITSGQAGAPDVTNNLKDVIVGLVSGGLAIGTIVAVCAGIVIAIKTMTDGANGKKELKEALTPYVIGCIVLFAGFTIWSGAVQIMENTLSSGAGAAVPGIPGSPSPLPANPGNPAGLSTLDNIAQANGWGTCTSSTGNTRKYECTGRSNMNQNRYSVGDTIRINGETWRVEKRQEFFDVEKAITEIKKI